MFRTLLCAVLALLLASSVGLAAGKGKKKANTKGTVVKFDTATGDLTVATGKKGNTTNKDFKLTDTVAFVVINGDVAKNLNAKDGFKELKSGDKVQITTDASGKVTKLQIGGKKKKK